MRLWHTDIIKGLPRQQLLSQWRELLAIKRTIDKQGTPNHILVNYVIDTKISDWKDYCNLVHSEMCDRDYNVSQNVFKELMDANISGTHNLTDYHDDTYSKICFYNLTEKFIRGGIVPQEYNDVAKCFEKSDTNMRGIYERLINRQH